MCPSNNAPSQSADQPSACIGPLMSSLPGPICTLLCAHGCPLERPPPRHGSANAPGEQHRRRVGVDQQRRVTGVLTCQHRVPRGMSQLLPKPCNFRLRRVPFFQRCQARGSPIAATSYELRCTFPPSPSAPSNELRFQDQIPTTQGNLLYFGWAFVLHVAGLVQTATLPVLLFFCLAWACLGCGVALPRPGSDTSRPGPGQQQRTSWSYLTNGLATAATDLNGAYTPNLNLGRTR